MKVFYSVPKEYKDKYLQIQMNFNIKSLGIIGFLMHLIQIYTYISSRISPFSQEAMVMKGYYWFYESIILVGTIIWAVMIMVSRSKNKVDWVMAIITRSYAFSLLFWGMGVAIADQFQGQNIVVYYVALFVLGIIVDFSVKDFTIILVIIQSIFVALLLQYTKYIGSSGELYYASTQYVFFAIIIRYYINEVRKKNFVQKSELEKLNDQLYFLSYYDPLSKIYNRRMWEQEYHAMYNKAVNREETIDVIITDIDYFKVYNDNYGHVAGDQIIRDVSDILIEATEGYERNVGRYGGDEFALAFYDLAYGESSRIITKIQDLLSRRISGSIKGVTMSFGSYRLTPTKDDKPWDLVALADQVLYKEKEKR